MRLFTLALLAAVLAGCSTPPTQPPPVLAGSPPIPPPPSAAPKPTGFLWLEIPTATPIEALAVIEYVGENPKLVLSAIEAVAQPLGAQGALRLPDTDIVGPEATFTWFAPNLSVSSQRDFNRRTRFVLFRFVGPSPFVVGYYHAESQEFLSGEDASIYPLASAGSASNFGRYVRSPYAPHKQVVNVVGVPDGAAVVCPYTHKPFVLW